MSIEDKLQKILNSKIDIKNAINNNGGEITNNTPFDEYATNFTNVCSDKDLTLASLIDKSATTIDIPQGTTKIGNTIFRGCQNLTTVNVPNSVTSVEDGAFYVCSKLTTVNFPSNMTSFGSNTFYNCSKLTNVTIPYGVTTIGAQVFWACTSLTSITIPDSVTSIGNSAFRACKLIKSIVVPNSVVTIAYGAFWGMFELEDAVFGTAVETIGSDIFTDKRYHLDFTIRVLATTPPTLGTNFVPSTFVGKIYVPDASVDSYKTATNWSAWKDYIYPLSEYIAN